MTRHLLLWIYSLSWLNHLSSDAAFLSSTRSHGNTHHPDCSTCSLRQQDQQQHQQQLETNSCPYSTRFAPHRIDLTRPKDLPRNSPWWSSLFPMRRERFERTVVCDRLLWYEQFDGLAVLKELFEQAATATEHTVVLAFPKTKTTTLLHHAVEIINPHATRWTVQVQWDPLPYILLTRNTQSNDSNSENDNTVTWINAETHQQRTQAWVQRLLVTHGICPYTRSDTRSGQGVPGVPVAPIAYRATPANDLLALVGAALDTIQRDMLDAGPERTSSILLAAPEFDERFDEWTGPFFAILQACIVAVSLEDTIGVVCFHPHYKVPDGQTWPGFGHMHSVPKLQQLTDIASWDEAAAGGAWQRRTPHATLNVLWAPQLALAEQQRKTTTLYRENIRKLVHSIGVEKLQQDLEKERNLL